MSTDPSSPERVIIQLPLSVTAVAAIADGLKSVWPECQVIFDGVPADKLVIELSGPNVYEP
jgi:hypothetical protein